MKHGGEIRDPPSKFLGSRPGCSIAVMLLNINNHFTIANKTVYITAILYPVLDPKTFDGGSLTLSINVLVMMENSHVGTFFGEVGGLFS